MSVLTTISRNLSAGASLFYITSFIVLGGILLIFYRDVDFSLKPLYMAEFVCMDVLALLSIYWLSPRHMRGFTLILIWGISLLLGANALYYRYWGSLLSPSTILDSSSYNSFVWNALGTLITPGDLLYIALPASLTAVWYIMRGMSFHVSRTYRLMIITLSLLLFFSAGIMRVRRHAIYLGDIGLTRDTWSTTFRIYYGSFGKPSGLGELTSQGLTVFTLSQVKSALSDKHITLTRHELQSIQSFLANHTNRHADALTRNKDKNLIFIIVESLNANYIGTIAGGRSVTHVLDSLLNTPGTVSSLNMISQTAEGGSSDGQMIYNTGLLPIKSGAASILYGDNAFPSIARALNDRVSVEVMPEHRSVWNHATTSVSYGYSGLFDSSDIESAGHNIAERGADGALFDFASAITDTISQPFMLTIPTISMHFPFRNPGVPAMPFIDASIPESSRRDYLNALNYFDTELGRFLYSLHEKGLYDNSIIVIASDHDMNVENPDLWMDQHTTNPIAFIALNTGIDRRISRITAQADVFPTILHIMGIGTDSYAWHGIGTSMLDDAHPGGAIDSTGRLHGDHSPALEQQWEISDLIIRSNYFSGRSPLN